MTSTQEQRGWMGVCVAVFFFWGLSTVLIDSLVPKLKELFDLGYAEVLLTQFSFFVGYLVFSLPAGHLLAHWGYPRSIALGLGLAVIGCLLLIPATLFGRFPWFLVALFVRRPGIRVAGSDARCRATGRPAPHWRCRSGCGFPPPWVHPCARTTSGMPRPARLALPVPPRCQAPGRPRRLAARLAC